MHVSLYLKILRALRFDMLALLQLMAVKRHGKTWRAWALGHCDIARAKEELEKTDRSSLSFTRLEVWLHVALYCSDLAACPMCPLQPAEPAATGSAS
jgi:hypothetical protein